MSLFVRQIALSGAFNGKFFPFLAFSSRCASLPLIYFFYSIFLKHILESFSLVNSRNSALGCNGFI